jgi:hypothetical protein
MSHNYRSSRRRFLTSLGLGAGAALLGPIATGLHRRAYGAEPTRKKNIVFIAMSAGLPDLQLGWPSRTDETHWELHEALAPLAPWKERMLVVRNLSLGLGAMQHSGGYGLMAGLGAGDGETPLGNAPQGQTIDQLIAEQISRDTPVRSLLFGVDQSADKVMHQTIFASGPDQPLPHPVRAAKLYESLFPGAAENQAHAQADRRVMARIHRDVDRLSQRLARYVPRGPRGLRSPPQRVSVSSARRPGRRARGGHRAPGDAGYGGGRAALRAHPRGGLLRGLRELTLSFPPLGGAALRDAL